MEVTLPWPPKELSPNSRGHWARKARAAKAYRAACRRVVEAFVAAAGGMAFGGGAIALWLEFLPPDRRGRDDDNLVASFKPGRDGLADALGVDDKRFVCRHGIGEPVPGGAVRVTVEDVRA